MPSLAPYIPSPDADLDLWSANFATLITASPPTYGLTAPDAVTIQAGVDAWHAAYLLVTSPTTKTATTVSDKNTAKINMLATVRPFAQQVALNPGVSSANKIALGLNPRTSTPTPITAPATNPVLSIISQAPGVVNWAYRDIASSPTVKSKPYGVKSLQLYGMPSATPIVDPTLLPQIATVTKSPYQFQFPGGYVRGMVWYFAAKWQIQTGEQGPVSPIVSIVAS